MLDLTISAMLQMQHELWEKYRDSWSPLQPEYARHSLLWMIEELGEAIAVIKKRGENDIMNDAEVRAAFVEELVDVQMYFNDVLMRYQIAPEEFSDAYARKHAHNMKRDYESQYKKFIKNQ